LIVECEHCRAKYHYDEERFAGKPSKKLRCSKCQSIFEVFNTRSYEAQPPVRPPIAPGETMLRRDRGASRPSAAPDRASTAERAGERAPASRPAAGCRRRDRRPGRKDVHHQSPVKSPQASTWLGRHRLSRQHAAVEVHGDEILLIDLGSTNGTLVGETLVTEAPLENQGEFTVGGSTLMLIVTPE
jgi:predicted Zn finger-like uncharacterized protein